MSTDPTNSATKRDRFTREFDRRWDRVERRIEARLENDESLDPTNENISGGRQSADFYEWYNMVLEEEVLEPMPLRHVRRGSHYTGPYVQDFYIHGMKEADKRLRQEGFDFSNPPTPEEIVRQQRFNPGIHGDALEEEWIEIYTDLESAKQDVLDETSDIYQFATRGDVAAIAALTGLTLRELGADDGTIPPPPTLIMAAKNRVDKTGKNRTTLISQAKSVQTINDAALNRYQEVGIDGVGIDVEMVVDETPSSEFVTAGDELVCPECQDRDGAIFPIDNVPARHQPPIHPNCRCMLTPARRTL